MKYWVAFHGDWSGFAFFAEEIDCLRYAVRNHMQVAQIELGKDVRDQVSARG